MTEKENLVVKLLKTRLESTKVGIIFKGLSNIDPIRIVCELAKSKSIHVYAAAIGYDSIKESQTETYSITPSIEKAVLWRSNPEYAGKIVVFIKNDADKLHSLAEFETLSIRDLTRYLIRQQYNESNNTPTQSFWKALERTSDYYFDDVMDFVRSILSSKDVPTAIPQNLWRLNLLCDNSILGSKSQPEERLRKNHELILAIGQLSEDSRKKLSQSLARSKSKDKIRLQNVYSELQKFYKYGKKESLHNLDYDVVYELFSATKDTKKTRKKSTTTGEGEIDDISDSSIKAGEFLESIANAVVSGEDIEDFEEVLGELKKHFDTETEDNESSILFNGRAIALDNNKSDLRKLVGRVCNESCWGGVLETDESVLKDAISADIKSFHQFNPQDAKSIISKEGNLDGSLFEFISRFDQKFEEEKLGNTESFRPAFQKLYERRIKLLENMDMLMYYPVLFFGVDEEARQDLIEYIKAWANLYHIFAVNDPTMRSISACGTSQAARALLLLDTLYVKTPREWKGILLPLHPLYLWRYYEVFKDFATLRSNLKEDEAKVLTETLNNLPQIVSFLIVNSLITDDEKVLPCSGNIEMLPTFENKTNRYLGDDGTQSIGEVLSRWIGFAPYTKNEVRICSVDAPDLIGNIRAIKAFMDKNECKRIVYDVYLTRNQNGNTELSKLDYSGKDYEIGEYIKSGRISIGVKNVISAEDVKRELHKKPVHVAFYFDQSSYAIEFGPNNKNLYINPLVVTYDYDYDDIQHKGSIYPSSDMESGLIGDYHKLLKSADVISNNMNPRTTYNGSADMTSVVSTIEEGVVQWLVVADRDTNNYDPPKAIPIGEMPYDRRMVNVWASSKSRVIRQYQEILRDYNLYPDEKTLISILKKFGHIASNGLISIPRYGADSQAIDNKKKGLLGTLFAASWYTKTYKNSLVASLDDSKARLWLYDSSFGNERADLVGLRYDSQKDLLYIQPIEVKTRDDYPDASFTKNPEGEGDIISGHAAGQIAAIIKMLREIFSSEEDSTTDMFVSARREVLKYQIVSECFRSIHDPVWQKEWHTILKRAFNNKGFDNIKINESGLLLHIKLGEPKDGITRDCTYSDSDDCHITYKCLTSKDIQEIVLEEDSSVAIQETPSFDDIIESDNNEKQSNSKQILVSPIDASVDESQNEVEVAEVSHSTGEKTVDSLPNKDSKSISQSGISDITITEKDSLHSFTEEIELLVRDFRRSCQDYHINLRECDPHKAVIGPSVIRLRFKLGRGQAKQGLEAHLEDIGREIKRSGVIVQDVLNSDELLLDIPRLQRDKVLFRDVISRSEMPQVTTPEQLYFPLGKTPDGEDITPDLSELPHLLVGGSTGSGKTVFLFTMLAYLLKTHPRKEDMQLILSSSKLEDFSHFEGLPHLYSGHIISDAKETTEIIKDVVFKESERRGKLLADAKVANIKKYNEKVERKLEPIVIVIDEFADLADQLESKKEKDAFYKPVQRIAQTGRSRGIHLVICTQRPEAKLVPPTTKAQLNGRVALRVNDGISSRMIIESPEAQYLQKHGDMIYKIGDEQKRVQGYLIEIEELDEIVKEVININKANEK